MTLRYCLMTNDFSEFVDWLESELNNREWNPADLAKKSGVDSGVISRVLSRERGIGNSTLKSIAVALGYPDVYVFRKAGIIDPVTKATEQTDLLISLFDQFPDDEKEELLTYMQLKLEILRKQGKIS